MLKIILKYLKSNIPKLNEYKQQKAIANCYISISNNKDNICLSTSELNPDNIVFMGNDMAFIKSYNMTDPNSLTDMVADLTRYLSEQI